MLPQLYKINSVKPSTTRRNFSTVVERERGGGGGERERDRQTDRRGLREREGEGGREGRERERESDRRSERGERDWENVSVRETEIVLGEWEGGREGM